MNAVEKADRCVDFLDRIYAMCEGAGTGSPTGDELNFCAEIYRRIRALYDECGIELPKQTVYGKEARHDEEA